MNGESRVPQCGRQIERRLRDFIGGRVIAIVRIAGGNVIILEDASYVATNKIVSHDSLSG